MSSTSIISKTPVGASCGKFEVLRPFAFSTDCYIFCTRSLFTSKRRAIASARSVLVLARTSGSGPSEDFWFWSWRGLLVLVLARTSGSGPGEDFWFWSWRGLLVLVLARTSRFWSWRGLLVLVLSDGCILRRPVSRRTKIEISLLIIIRLA